MAGAGRTALVSLAVIGGLFFLVLAAWAVDTSVNGGRVSRHVTVGGRQVGGFSRTQVAATVDELAKAYETTPVRIDAPGGGFSVPPGELGLQLRRNATVQAVMDVGRRGPAAGRFGDWVGGWFGRRPAPVRIAVDQAAVYRVVAEKDTARTAPVEPGLRAVEGRLEPVPGRPGQGLDPSSVLAELPRAAARGGLPVRVSVRRGAVPPRFGVEDIAPLVHEGERLAAEPLAVIVDDERGTVPVATLRGWLRAVPSGAGVALGVDGEQAAKDLAALLPGAGTPAVETAFNVEGGAVRIVPGSPGTACCSPVAAERITRALRERADPPLALPLTRVDPKLTPEEAAALGVIQEVGTFTTNHAPGQPRVTNIHRIADIVRGQVIEPGSTFSINEFVGKRTRANGFVVDAVIEDGLFAESVGGGISQFATTTFNAAFFAGMEFDEYQSHSLYISRYPYGREATLSFPHPDLRIKNPSPYGVLLWPTYTDRSITVTLYSTKWVEVTQSNQTKEARGPCTRVRTERTRVLVADGTTKVDSILALYRPKEGVDC
ncbi:MAG: VanW family protein [Acidimicrobiales bacterium]